MTVLKEITDLPFLIRWRKEVIENVFGVLPDSDLLRANEEYYARHFADNTHYALVAVVDGEECGCGGVCFTEELPSPDNPSGCCAYLMNIYVREPYRSHGVAHEIVNRLVEESSRRGCGKIYLETTDKARSLYDSVGFRPLPDIMKYYDTEN